MEPEARKGSPHTTLHRCSTDLNLSGREAIMVESRNLEAERICFLCGPAARPGFRSWLVGALAPVFSEVPMPSIARITKFAAAAVLAAAPLTGCLFPPSPRQIGKAILHAPPPPRIEVHRPPRPSTGHVWTDGRWEWNGSRWVWNSGSWAKPPSRNKVWVPGHWDRTPAGHVYVPGHWK